MIEKTLSLTGVAVIYVGTIMGAGFASGREIWQFFGVFGKESYIGVFVVGVLFVLLGIMISIIAIKLDSGDMGKIIVPGGNKILTSFVGYFMALILFSVLITMSAAGGALFYQQFGLPRVMGGAVIIILVIFTVIGGFDRVSGIFKLLMPILVCIVIGTCLLIMLVDLDPASQAEEVVPSPLASNRTLSAILYLSYNILAVVPIIGTSALKAKNNSHAIGGAALGGFFLFCLVLMISSAMLTDMEFSQAMDMPMLGFTARISPVLNTVYACVMMFAIYAAATSIYYSFTTKLKAAPNKNRKIVIIALIGFLLGLMGFKNVVEYMYPLEGFLGIAIILMVTVNFFMVIGKKDKKDIFEVFGDDFDRFEFPGNIHRVTAGHGGEALLIVGSQKTALLDCGMAYCGRQMVRNLTEALEGQGRDSLDLILLSHSHYDHIGALPYVKEVYPQAVVYGSRHCQDILQRPNAKTLIKQLGTVAAELYMPESNEEILIDDLKVDKVLTDDDTVSLGKETIRVLETKGHTDCSLSFGLEPQGLLFTSESTGILEAENYVHTPILKSFSEAFASAEKCKAYAARYICLPHFGMLPEEFNNRYWQMFDKECHSKIEFVAGMRAEGKSENEMLEEYVEKYWTESKEKEQPKEAYIINSKNILRAILKEQGSVHIEL